MRREKRLWLTLVLTPPDASWWMQHRMKFCFGVDNWNHNWNPPDHRRFMGKVRIRFDRRAIVRSQVQSDLYRAPMPYVMQRFLKECLLAIDPLTVP